MKYKIYAPNKAYTGMTAGVAFANGVAVTEREELLDWFEEKGYDVELEEDQPFVIDGKEIGKVEGDYITITDQDVIDETMKDVQDSEVEATGETPEAVPEVKAEGIAVAEETAKSEEAPKEAGKKSTGKK